MRAVLGIDAAWTPNNPSGVAVAAENLGGWHLVAAASSYQCFWVLAGRPLGKDEITSGLLPNASSLLDSAAALCGCPVDLVAIDMPLSYSPIVGRRCSDDAVSKAYGARQCGTHSPSSSRPGSIGDALRESFGKLNYPLLIDKIKPPGIVEVYPHPALVELAGASARLPYKSENVGRYWPTATPSERRELLYRQWKQIVDLLETKIAGVAKALPQLKLTATGKELKAYEDTLDAIVCAWVAVCCLEGKAKPHGDENSAIWIPTDISKVRAEQVDRNSAATGGTAADWMFEPIIIKPDVEAIIARHAAIDWKNPPHSPSKAIEAYKRRLSAAGLTRDVRWIVDPAFFDVQPVYYSRTSGRQAWDRMYNHRAGTSRGIWDARKGMNAWEARTSRDPALAQSGRIEALAKDAFGVTSTLSDVEVAVGLLNIQIEHLDPKSASLLALYGPMIDAFEAGSFAHVLTHGEVAVLAAPAIWTENGALHRADGPAIEWPLTKAWYWRGVEVTEQIIMRPDEITKDAIDVVTKLRHSLSLDRF